ncbi:MAG: hypothetical protein RMK49_00055 [Abditibacteriales bacterium]|nr:hypothetical protein [Abditibacteriales bacterium]
MGNRLTKTEGGNTTTYTYNSVNELTSSSEGSYTYDANGNTLTDAQGTEAVITARMDYDVYGKVRTQSGSSSNKFKYVAAIGHPTDDKTGLIYMKSLLVILVRYSGGMEAFRK